MRLSIEGENVGHVLVPNDCESGFDLVCPVWLRDYRRDGSEEDSEGGEELHFLVVEEKVLVWPTTCGFNECVGCEE